MDEIRPGYLKPLDVVGLTCLCKVTWQLGAVLQDWQTPPPHSSASLGELEEVSGGREVWVKDVNLTQYNNLAPVLLTIVSETVFPSLTN